MAEYKSKQELIDEISNSAKLFINEFADIQEADKDKLLDGVDRTPAQISPTGGFLMETDVIIIGAGASGLVAAIAAARCGSSVLVIEQKEKAGKKILATGNGKCNFTNLLQTAECYRSEDKEFPGKVLSGFDVRQTIQFFQELGIYPKERNGYLYPNSEQAASVVQVLLLECKRLGVSFHFQEKVIRIQKPEHTVTTEVLESGWTINTANNGLNYIVITKVLESEEINKNGKKTRNKEHGAPAQVSRSKSESLHDLHNIQKKQYYARKLILSCGGCASPALGSDGSGYALAQGLGHTLIKPLPALVQLKSPDKFCKTLSGVRVNAGVIAVGQHAILDKEEGEVIFTDYGISGIPIMQLSRFVAKALDKKEKVYLLLDYLPSLPQEQVFSLLQERIRHNPDKTAEEMMAGFFNSKLSYIFIREAGLDPLLKAAKLNCSDVEAIAKQIKEFKIVITDTNSFENAQVCAGGISTKEVDEKTLESKKSENLYLTGELLDVDGTCGGYNLQWAWTTGYLAGSAVVKP